MLLRHQEEASSAKRRETIAFKRCCFIHLNIKKDFREPKLRAEAALGDVGAARPVADEMGATSSEPWNTLRTVDGDGVAGMPL